MKDKMVPQSFEQLLTQLMQSYQGNQTFFGVKVSRSLGDPIHPIGPAAGPHTQLAGNIVAAFGAGADYFELKTVQVIEGQDLAIAKPCIYTAHEVYNSEWSTELRVVEAEAEYIKGYMLNYILAIEFELADPDQLKYVMSVGYDLTGIQSPRVDHFIETMKEAGNHPVWQSCMNYLETHINKFERVTLKDLTNMPSTISATVTLSTMHGCAKEEIEAIVQYLILEKATDTYVKMNPTLLGKEAVSKCLDDLGYSEMEINDEVFAEDLTFEESRRMLERLIAFGLDAGRKFGVKLTNTLPVKNQGKPLKGETIYLSGPALYPLTIQVVALMAEAFNGQLPISYSGGADAKNVLEIARTGVYPITVSSVLLKPGGYKNLSRMAEALDQGTFVMSQGSLDVQGLRKLSEKSLLETRYTQKESRKFPRLEIYNDLCAACNNCIDTCPNRANEALILDGEKVIVHYDDLCNACGNCSGFCIKGHDPYLEKWTINNRESIDMVALRQHSRILKGQMKAD